MGIRKKINNIITNLTKDFSSTVATESGTDLSSGNFSEEYLSALKFPNAYSVYSKMSKQDYQIKRVLRAINAPLMNADYRYYPKDDNDAEQVKQANFKNKVLYEWQDESFYNTLENILTFLKYGFSIFEPYAKSIEDKEFGTIITLANLGYIKQSTVYKWYKKQNKLDKITQKVQTSEVDIEKDIAGDQLLVFTNDKEGDNFEGESILRSTYGNYIRKDLYLRLDMIGIEKMSVGTPVFYLPKAMLDNPVEVKRFQTIGSAYTSHQKQYILLDDRLKNGGFEIKEGAYNSDAVDKSIRREDKGIVDSILASFLEIGATRAGGNAQNEGQMELFLKSLVHIAKYTAEQLDIVTHYYYVLNFGEPEVNLKITPKNITSNDAKNTMEIIRGYVQSKVIRPDDRLETKLRNDLELPEMELETVRELDEKKDYYGNSGGHTDNPSPQSSPADSVQE